MKYQIFLYTFLLSVNAYAASFEGMKTVYLEDNKAQRQAIATLSFEPQERGYGYRLSFIEKEFGDYFLSMRPFRCHDAGRLVCRQPYPYKMERVISKEDLRALEYDLMFISRSANEYGIDPYNGRYYRLKMTPKGFVGTIYGLDMNHIASPPEKGVVFPITLDVLDEMEAESVQFPKLIIE